MATLRVLGSCSGTEPMPGRQHTSVVLTVGDRNYFFDAGEACDRAAYLAGVDLLKTRAIFLSHAHFDHIGGLMGLCWCVRKLSLRAKTPAADGVIRLYLPETAVWENLRAALCFTEGAYDYGNLIRPAVPSLGAFYGDENLRVSCFPSTHVKPAPDGRCRSFVYRFEAAGRRVVYSGDVGTLSDLLPALEGGCDLLLCETGHHKVSDVCEFAALHAKELLFYHHGREILEDRPSVAEALEACPIPVSLAEDGTTAEW